MTIEKLTACRRDGLLALATALCLLPMVACAGGSGAQEAQKSRQARLLAAMPRRLSGEPPLEVMPISGEVWLQTYESAYPLGLRVSVRKWLKKLDRDADDIAVAWSRSRLIWVVGYSVEDVPAERLIPTFLASAFPRAKPRITRETIGFRESGRHGVRRPRQGRPRLERRPLSALALPHVRPGVPGGWARRGHPVLAAPRLRLVAREVRPRHR